MSIRKVSMVQAGEVKIRPLHVKGNGLPPLLWLLTSRRWTAPLPINIFIIEHEKGLVLFDTGQDQRSISDPAYFPKGIIGWLYKNRLAKFSITSSETLIARLGKLGYRPEDVRYVIISHLHQDHIGGISHFPNAEIIVDAVEWQQIHKPLPELDGYLAKHINLPGLKWKRITFTRTEDDSIKPFMRSYDIFGDKSLVLLPTPGHTAGSMSLLVRQDNMPPLLFVGDLTFDVRLLANGHIPGVGKPSVLKKTSRMVNELKKLHPNLVILAAHDPAAKNMFEQASATSLLK